MFFDLLIFLFILGVLIVVHEFGHFMAAKKMQVRVEKFSLGLGPKIIGRKNKDTEYTLNILPIGGYVKMAGDNLEEFKGKSYEYLAKSPARRGLIIFCGPLINYIFGFLCFCAIFLIGYPQLTTKVGGLKEGFGAKEAGIMVGDKIIAIDGKNVAFWEDLQRVVQSKNSADLVKVIVLRDNKELSIDVKIKEESLDDTLGQRRKVALLGIMPVEEEVVEVRYGPVQSFVKGANKTLELTLITYRALWRMILGKLSLRESMTGPLGVFYITSKAAKIGLIALMHLVAALSVSLAIFNLLPLPVLDGGHIALLIVEKIRGRYLSLKAERLITQIGFSVILALVIIVAYNDIVRFFGDKIAGFLNQWQK